MNIQIKTIKSMSELPMKTTTVGYWIDDGENATIYIHHMSDWRFMVAVLFHELIEWAICKHKGVTQAECDAFDEKFEVKYEKGLDKSYEPGDDHKCPYFLGHQHGNKLEKMIIFVLGASWKKYLKECGDICDCEYPV